MYIFGASGHGKVIASILADSNINIKGFIDDNPKRKSLMGLPIFHSKEMKTIPIEKLVIAIGNNKIRKQISERLENDFFSVIHTSAIYSKTNKIKKGTVVCPNTVINAETIIGAHCIINTGTIVEHDCILENFVHISPNATIAGGVNIGEGTHVGAGAVVIPSIKIGKWVTIGAGSIIIRDIPDYAVVVGNPGKVIKYNKAYE